MKSGAYWVAVGAVAAVVLLALYLDVTTAITLIER